MRQIAKIVQISSSGSAEGDIYTEYLDNMGRVWYQDPVYIQEVDPYKEGTIYKKFSHYEWKKLELPPELTPDEKHL